LKPIRADIDQAAHDVCAKGFKEGVVELEEIRTCARIEADDGMAQARAYERKIAHAVAVGALRSNTVGGAARAR
jgi:hypothetical protein